MVPPLNKGANGNLPFVGGKRTPTGNWGPGKNFSWGWDQRVQKKTVPKIEDWAIVGGCVNVFAKYV